MPSGVWCGAGYGEGGRGIQDGCQPIHAPVYYYDSIGSGENCRRYDAPTDKEIADFANARWNSTAYVDKLDAIITQKWLHFGFLVSREAWSDIRRTGYPSGLVFPEVSGTIPNVPNRWRYPSTEVKLQSVL